MVAAVAKDATERGGCNGGDGYCGCWRILIWSDKLNAFSDEYVRKRYLTSPALVVVLVYFEMKGEMEACSI